MEVFAFWNNKGGTGKTSIAFQAITKYSSQNQKKKILVIDLCPQSNLSELLLGGLLGDGSGNLQKLYGTKRKSVGGYFQDRLPTPFTMPSSINAFDYIIKPSIYNSEIHENLFILAGDPIVELQANAIATLANTQLPGTDTWTAVIDWIRDFLNATHNEFDTVFIDCNPSFSIYTQIAISSADKLLLPVMADDSSRRALQNVFSLVYGIKMPSSMYEQFSFSTKLLAAKRELPRIHLLIKNRLTQYMGPASAYFSVLTAIDQDILRIMKTNPKIFTFTSLKDGVVDIRDFQTTGIVSFAEGRPFYKMSAGTHKIFKKRTVIREDYLENCKKAIEQLVKFL
jgi:cellulose biosynthesis protein BcsQ